MHGARLLVNVRALCHGVEKVVTNDFTIAFTSRKAAPLPVMPVTIQEALVYIQGHRQFHQEQVLFASWLPRQHITQKACSMKTMSIRADLIGSRICLHGQQGDSLAFDWVFINLCLTSRHFRHIAAAQAACFVSKAASFHLP